MCHRFTLPISKYLPKFSLVLQRSIYLILFTPKQTKLAFSTSKNRRAS